MDIFGTIQINDWTTRLENIIFNTWQSAAYSQYFKVGFSPEGRFSNALMADNGFRYFPELF